MKKAKRGQPPKKPADLKKTMSIRLKDADKKMLTEKFGSIQIFFDQCLAAENES